MKDWEMLLLCICTWIKTGKNPGEMKAKDIEIEDGKMMGVNEYKEAARELNRRGYLPNYAETGDIIFLGAEISESAIKEVDNIMERYKNFYQD